MGNIFYQFLLIEGGVIKFHTHIQYGKGSLHIECGGNNVNEKKFNKFKGESSPKKGKKPSEMEIAPCYILFTLFTLFKLLKQWHV